MMFSDRANHFRANIFNILNDLRLERMARGGQVYNMSVGTPDFQPAAHVMQAVSEAALNPENYKYSLTDTKELLDAVIAWYKRRFGVDLAADEIMSVYGTQEGMAHIAMVMCNPSDVVLVPNPCYPIFQIGPYLSGAQTRYYDLLPENGYLPDLDNMDADLLARAKMMVVCYPANPVCAVAPFSFYEKLVAFAKKHDILIVNDNAYSEIIYDGNRSYSIFEVPGAKEVAVEFNSLSKSYNLTGIRISFLLGNREVVAKFKALRSQFDYGTSFLVQKAAIAALNGDQAVVKSNCEKYQQRRDALCGGLRKIGWDVPDSQGSMFAWAPLPAGYTDSEKFCVDLLEKSGALCTPGSSFGPLGEGHVRFALVLSPEEIEKMIASIDACGILRG